ncbi:hypothetical protein ACFLYF_06770 [Chloroflexota bacterium]
MSQENKDKADAAEARTQQTRGFMQQVRVAARRKNTPEEKVRIAAHAGLHRATYKGADNLAHGCPGCRIFTMALCKTI